MVCVCIIDTYHLDNVDLDSTGPVSIYRVYLGSLSSHVWIVCGLLSQLLYNMFMVGIPLIMFYYKHHHDLTEVTYIAQANNCIWKYKILLILSQFNNIVSTS
jgi:hypothetical protein